MAPSKESPSSNGSLSSVPYALTAAGHEGITIDASGSLLIKPCTQAEINFYESAKFHPAFQAHMPVYMGSLTLNTDPDVTAAATGAEISKAQSPPGVDTAPISWKPSSGAKLKSDLSIVLSNATAGFKQPNVLDLKLGARLWDDDAPPAKRQRLDDVAKSSTSGTLGFRVAGMKVYVGDHDDNEQVSREVNTTVSHGYKTYDKFYGRSNIQVENVRSAFDAFLSSVDLPVEEMPTERRKLKQKLVERFCQEVESIQSTLEAEESRMYSASILMVYEGDPVALEEAIAYREAEAQPEQPEQESGDVDEEDDGIGEEEEDDVEEKYKVHEVVMIDFAHAHWTPGQGPDENALRGVRNICKILHEMLEELK